MTNLKRRETLLWLVRHPQPDASATGRCYGSLDIGLSKVGIRQARMVAMALARHDLPAIYTSPAQRCQEAASLIASSRQTVIVVDDLREIDFGSFEGKRYDDIARQNPEIYSRWMKNPTEVQFPAGESFDQMRERVLRATKRLRKVHHGESIAIVTHGGVIRTMLADALGMPHANIFRLGQSYAGVSLIRYIDQVPIIELMNARVGETDISSEAREV